MLKINFVSQTPSTQGLLVVTTMEKELGVLGGKLDKKLGGTLSRALKASASFKGSKGQILPIIAPAGTKLDKILLLGLGKAEDVTDNALNQAGGAVAAFLLRNATSATLLLDDHKDIKIPAAKAAVELGLGASLRSYAFDKYRTKLKPEQKITLKTLTIACQDNAIANRLWKKSAPIAESVLMARDLVNEPANVLYPETMAARCAQLKKHGLKVEILDERQLKKLGMGALLGVAQGSVRPPRVVILKWQGNPKAKDKRPVAFVGKGVTFDTGGISLKPAAGMEDMKTDMAGAAAVIGSLAALAGRKAKVNAIGIIGLVENMPDGKAQRPGDIVTSMSGQTIEVINTDAEGRLVLADALWYACHRFNPRAIVDLATLTGAISIALGREYAGLFSNDDKLSKHLTDAGQAVEEKLWRFPLHENYDKQIDTPVADMKNTGGRDAGSITAAQFLQRFVKKGVAWAHLDIAAVARPDKDGPLCPKGASGFGIRLLDRFVMDYIEGK